MSGQESFIANPAVLPISQIPSMHACILTAGHLLPLEDIFKIPAQDTGPSDAYADKRTWRTPRPEEEQAAREKRERWTAGGIMEARALDRGYRETHIICSSGGTNSSYQ